jgi:GST-like protein
MKEGDWTPTSKIEAIFKATAGNNFSSINSPKAGARAERELPVGTAPFQLYSLGTPNGQKVGIILEELEIDYDAHVIPLSGDQFNSGFVAVNPNSKIPSAVDKQGPDGKPFNLFESCSIMLYLAEKHNKFLPVDKRLRSEVITWLFWQAAGQGPMTGQFGHFMVYAPPDKKEARDYGVARYGMEVQRLCSVLENHLATRKYMVGEEYTIADMAIFPWFNQLRVGYNHPSGIGAKEFLTVSQYVNANAWADRIAVRPAVIRGITVCSAGKGKPWLESKV